MRERSGPEFRDGGVWSLSLLTETSAGMARRSPSGGSAEPIHPLVGVAALAMTIPSYRDKL